MAYTNPWTTAQPVDTDAVSGADDEIRKLRLDIQERMDDIMGVPGGWATDPITQTQTRKQHIHWSDFSSTQGGSTLAVAGDFCINSASAVTMYAPVLLPRGVTVTMMEIQGKSTGTTAALTCTLEKVDATTGTPTRTTLATITLPAGSPVANYQITGSVGIVIDNTPANFIYYYLKVTWPADGTGLAGFIGVNLVYTSPNLNRAV